MAFAQGRSQVRFFFFLKSTVFLLNMLFIKVGLVREASSIVDRLHV
jgi:hypothetical protein